MVKFNQTNFLYPYRVRHSRVYAFLITLVLMIGTLFCSPLLAQETIVLPPADISCTSKDLEVKEAALPAPTNNPCECDATRALQLKIANKTGSTRTSFAMWGTLIRYNASGVPVDENNNVIPDGQPIGKPIFACASGIGKNSEKFYTTTTYIKVNCNQSLEIVDVVMAWTSSSPGETCEVLKNNPGSINPKCGRVPSIQITTGVDANINVTQATCANNNRGTITVSPFGSTGPYTVAIGSDSRSVNAGSSAEFTLPAGGPYTINITDAKGCTKTLQRPISSPDGVTAEAGEAFTKTCTAFTNGQQIGEAPQEGYTYSWSSAPAGFSSQVANPTVNPTATTTYTVTKTNTATGCSGTDNVLVTVNTSAPDVTGIGGAFTKTCTANTSGATIGETPVSGYSYAWTPATGLSATNIGNPTANPSTTTTYTVRKTNTASGCYQDATVTVTVNNERPTFTVCLVKPSLCANDGSVTFTASGGSDFQYSIDGGASWETSNVFNNLGSGSVSSFKVKNSYGCISDAVDCSEAASTCNNITQSVRNTTEEQQEQIQTQSAGKVTDVIARINENTRVLAAPNPFTDKVRFTLESAISGPGSLEIYNTMGQRIATVYQGHIEAGKALMKEYVVPESRRANLIYVFRVGDQKTTGKLLNR